MWRKWIRRILLSVVVLAVALAIAFPYLIDAIGGSSSRCPDELDDDLSADARALVVRAFDRLEPERTLDYHTHLVGLGAGGTGCYVHAEMRSWWHITKRVQFEVYRSAARIEDDDNADAQYVARLVDLIRNIEGHGRYLLLAFDKHYDSAGKVVDQRTEFYTPNAYMFKVAAAHPDCFVPAISVHPYRRDAVAALEKWAQRGARVVKWLPNSMGIDPSHDLCAPYYAKMREHGMVLLTHAGDEKAVDAEEDQRYGNPLLLRRALDAGVKVVVAHCASLGTNADLDDPKRQHVDNFKLFLRLMDERRYEGLLWGEISATTQRNRLPTPLRTMLTRTDLHPRLVNGSDYPLPAINSLVSTKVLVEHGFLTPKERKLLNEIFDFNPLLFDFVLKRTVKGPEGQRFPASVFTEHPVAAATPRVR